ncbi:MAG: PQQ-binding-like beta-propeller repeat protein [Candidatus Lokiarchaeia archaeon]
MKWKLLTLFTCVLLLAVFSIPAVTHNAFLPVVADSPKGDSTGWRVQADNAVGFSLICTANESYLYVGGAMLTDTTWKYALWKYNSSGVNIWNTTINITGYSTNGFSKLALSPDEGAIYAVGMIQNGSQYDGILVKFNTSDGGYLWNYTLSGPSYDRLYGVAVSPDGEIVYTSGMLSKSTNMYGNTSFYVAALNSTDGNNIWEYEIHESGQWGYSQDLTVSPTRNEVYAVGYYYISGAYTKLVALNATDGSPLWNISSSLYYLIYSVKVSLDGNVMYVMVPSYYAGSFLTISTSNGSILGNITLDGASYPFSFDISPDKSKIFTTALSLAYPYGYIITAKYDFVSGALTGVLTAPDDRTHCYDVVASNNNESVYVAGLYSNGITGETYMFLLKDKPRPLTSPLTLLLPYYYIISSQSPILSTPMNSIFLGAVIATLLVVAGFLVSKILRGRVS